MHDTHPGHERRPTRRPLAAIFAFVTALAIAGVATTAPVAAELSSVDTVAAACRRRI